jgi:hypothetical protein
LSSTRIGATILALAGLAVTLTGCGGDKTMLGQIEPNSNVTVFADMWDENADEGDQALVEQKPKGVWVIDTSVHFSNKRSGDFDVEIRLTDEGQFEVVDMGSTLYGYDHDNCLSPHEPEHYVRMLDTSIQDDPKDSKESSDDSNDDCVATV